MGDSTCLIDGFGPLPVRRPACVAEVGELVREAAAAQQALYPVGGQTTIQLGAPPTRNGFAVDVRGLDQVIDYPARDMTVTIQAGLSVARLQDMLALEGQRLPIDVPCPARATVGGVLAVNASGPRRFGYGTLRDYLLGISAVNDEGQEIKAGGRVVKNVAGYDLGKLFIGSVGTLGIMTQVTLKLRPLPEEQALIVLGCGSDGPDPVLELLAASRTRPVCLDLYNEPGWRRMTALSPEAGSWTMVVGYEGNGEAVKWQVLQLIREVRGRCTLEARFGSTALPLWDNMTEFPAAGTGEGLLTFKANLLPSATASFCRQADAIEDRPALQAHAGNGIVVGHAGPGLTKERATALVRSLRELAQLVQGRVIVLGCPPSWKEGVNVWGPPRSDVWLMREIKEKLDPRRLFNPGRFVDGI